jgi:hypothetical protein
MIKIGDIYISDDGCGDFIIRLHGPDAIYFVIKGREIYFKDEIALEPRIYKGQVYLENLPNTVAPKYTEFNVDRRFCAALQTTTKETLARQHAFLAALALSHQAVPPSA